MSSITWKHAIRTDLKIDFALQSRDGISNYAPFSCQWLGSWKSLVSMVRTNICDVEDEKGKDPPTMPACWIFRLTGRNLVLLLSILLGRLEVIVRSVLTDLSLLRLCDGIWKWFNIFPARCVWCFLMGESLSWGPSLLLVLPELLFRYLLRFLCRKQTSFHHPAIKQAWKILDFSSRKLWTCFGIIQKNFQIRQLVRFYGKHSCKIINCQDNHVNGCKSGRVLKTIWIQSCAPWLNMRLIVALIYLLHRIWSDLIDNHTHNVDNNWARSLIKPILQGKVSRTDAGLTIIFVYIWWLQGLAHHLTIICGNAYAGQHISVYNL